MKTIVIRSAVGRGIAFLALAAAMLVWSAKPSAAGQPPPPNSLTEAERKAGWVPLFDGQSLTGWKTSENPSSFTVRDGSIVAQGRPRSHLYYAGPVEKADFKDFELRLDARSKPGSNGGVYFHARFCENDWPQTGCEVQIDNSRNVKRKTGSLYAIQDAAVFPARDDEWFSLHVIVQGKRVVVRVNDKEVVDWTQPADFQPPKNPTWSDRRLGSGAFALQAHDPRSVVEYRNIRVKPLSGPRAIESSDAPEVKDAAGAWPTPQARRLASGGDRVLEGAEVATLDP